MTIENAHVNFVQDDEGVMAITDIADLPKVKMAELVYDGKNVAFLNRDNRFFALQNIPPYLRENIMKSAEITIIEQQQKDVYAYSVYVRKVDDMEIPDTWDEYAQNTIASLKQNMPEEYFALLAREATKFKQ